MFYLPDRFRLTFIFTIVFYALELIPYILIISTTWDIFFWVNMSWFANFASANVEICTWAMDIRYSYNELQNKFHGDIWFKPILWPMWSRDTLKYIFTTYYWNSRIGRVLIHFKGYGHPNQKHLSWIYVVFLHYVCYSNQIYLSNYFMISISISFIGEVIA